MVIIGKFKDDATQMLDKISQFIEVREMKEVIIKHSLPQRQMGLISLASI
jgi:hypothetical protein